MAPARIGQAEVEQPVLQHLPRHGDRLVFEQREIRDPQYAGPVLLQEHHLLGRPMQGTPLLDAALQGPLAPVPLLARPELLKVQQQGLGFQLRRLLKHRHQHALPDLGQGIGAGAPMATPLLLLPLGLQLAAIDPLRAAHRNPRRISRHLLAEPIGTFCHVPLLDP